MPKQGEIDQSYPLRLLNQNKIQLLEEFKGAKKHHKMKCLTCLHEWVATPISKFQTYKKYKVSGCPICNEKRRNDAYNKFRLVNLEKLKARGIEILEKNYDGRRHTIDEHTYTKILVRNNKCGHEFYCSPSNLFTQNVECGICGPQKRVESLTRWSKANSAKWKETATEWQLYKHSVSALTRETYKNFHHIINPNNLIRHKAGVAGAYHLDHIVPIRFCFEHKIPENICADASNLQMIGWRENVGSRHHLKGNIPPIFYSYIDTNTKLVQYANILKKKVFHDAQLFFSINGVIVTLYSSLHNHAVLILPIDNTYADKKTALLASKQLSTAKVSFSILFEDEFENLDLICSKLKHYTNQNKTTPIHARKCIIKSVNREEKSVFLNQFHIQRNDNSQIAYGAYYNNELIALMTFSQPRAGIGVHKNKKENMFELVRFATNINYRIPGIASKLLTHFKKNHEWAEIYSYADMRWSIGNLYYKLEFQLVKTNPPDYFYIIDGKRKHRWNYRKDILKKTLPSYNPNLTEYQNMVNHGYYRVWDCGTLKFSMTNI